MPIEIKRRRLTGGEDAFTIQPDEKEQTMHKVTKTVEGLINHLCTLYDLVFCDVVDIFINLEVDGVATIQ